MSQPQSTGGLILVPSAPIHLLATDHLQLTKTDAIPVKPPSVATQ